MVEYIAKNPCIHLDTYAYCNAKCTFCLYHGMTRKHGVMEMALFTRIIDEISSWDVPPPELVPVHYGEFFLNPNWLDMLKYIDQKLPHTKIAIPTNGSTIDGTKIDEITKIKNVHYINFSMYTSNPSTYSGLIGLPVSTIDKIRHAIKRIKELRKDMAVTVGTTIDTSYVPAADLKSLTAEFGHMVAPHDITSQYDGTVHRNRCGMIFLSMMILFDGKVCMCCRDVDGELIVGDINHNTILEVWYSNLFTAYRTLHTFGMRDRIHMCRHCTYEHNKQQAGTFEFKDN